MRSKAEIIRQHLAGLAVLDIGGVGYAADNPYERELAAAWGVCRRRVRVDCAPGADVRCDLNAAPFPDLADRFDAATAFDVLEHLERPVAVLRWIPAPRLIVTLPNALSPIARRMEERGRFAHLYSFTPYTARTLLERGGWRVTRIEFQFGKWSLAARVVNALGSLFPSRAGTGIVLFCERTAPQVRENMPET